MSFRTLLAFLVPCFLVAIPVLMQPKNKRILSSAAEDTLIILTPNSSQIKHEFELAFRDFYKKETGKDINIDWRSPGGTNDIVRYIDDRFTVEFQRYAEKNGINWNKETEQRFKNQKLKHGEDSVRDLFLDSQIGIDADLFFGGGTYDHNRFAQIGYAVNAGVQERHPEYFNDDVIPMQFAGEQLYDKNGGYYGYCLATFGIAYNPIRIKEMGVQPPENWIDLTKPCFFNELIIADPTKSGSITKCYEMIIQQAMQELGPEKGWEEGFRRVILIAANARQITDSAGYVVRGISAGDAAAGMCIDFYGLSEAEWAIQTSGTQKIVYVMPHGGTSLSADPIQLLRGAPHRKAAELFIDFLLSSEGSALWLLKPGTKGGPRKYAQLRPCIRKDTPKQLNPTDMNFPDYRPYENIGDFTYHGEWTGSYFSLIRILVKCIALDPQDELTAAWQAVIQNGGPVNNPDAMKRFLKIPVTFANAKEASQRLYGTKEEVAEIRRIWTEQAWQNYHEILLSMQKSQKGNRNVSNP